MIKMRSRYCGLTGDAVKRKSQGRLKLRQNQAKKKRGWGGGGTGQSRQDWQHTHWPRDERHGEHSESIILKGVKRE